MGLINSLNDWTLFGIIFTGIIIVLGMAEFIRHYIKWAPESTRQFIHIFIGLIVASGPFIFKANVQLITLSILFIVINMILLMSGKVNSMHATERKSYGTVYFPLSVLIMSCLWWDKPVSFILAIFVLAIADPIAAFIGKNGRTTFIPWRDKKSRRGSLAMF
jgi:phytol kinase